MFISLWLAKFLFLPFYLTNREITHFGCLSLSIDIKGIFRRLAVFINFVTIFIDFKIFTRNMRNHLPKGAYNDFMDTTHGLRIQSRSDFVFTEAEQDWIAQAIKGDQAAFGELVTLHQSAVYNLCYRMLGERGEAEDAAQEAFLRAYAHLDRYETDRSFRTWVLSIASNHCIDRLRKRRLIWLSLDETLPPHAALHSDVVEPEDAVINQERSDAVQTMLADLPPDYRAAVVLRYWYDLSYAEIAEMLNTTESAIKSRLFRARQTLADKLATPKSAAALRLAWERA
jgi:RNA polymerase sigma-70 factor (ECF subfamily)